MAVDLGSPSDFHDLCILGEGNWRRTIRAAFALGYNRVAVETYVDESASSSTAVVGKKKKKNLGDVTEAPKEIPPPPTFTEATEGQSVLFRLTYAMGDTMDGYRVSQSRNAKKYDIVAVRPTNLKSFQNACQTLNVEIIQFKIPLSYRPQRKMLLAAIKRGVVFELLYSPILQDQDVRSKTIGLAHELYTLYKLKCLIVSSGARLPLDLRSPFDVCNIAALFGLNEEEARKSVAGTPRTVLLRSLARKTVKGTALVRPVPPNAKKVISEKPAEDSESLGYVVDTDFENLDGSNAQAKRPKLDLGNGEDTRSHSAVGVPKYPLSGSLIK